MVFLQSVINGILLGGLYAIIGIGMSLVFGIVKLTNIAHGDLMIFCSFITMVLTLNVTGNVLLSLAVTVIAAIALGFLIQTFLVNKVMKGMAAEPPLLIMFGVSVILQNLLIIIFGANARVIPNPLSTTNVLSSANLSISGSYLQNFIIGILVILALRFIIQKTYFGMTIRATAGNQEAAELLGVNTRRIFAYTMSLAMITAAVAGLLVGQTFPFYPSTGTQYLITAFGVVVIGGMGSLGGTLLGGILLGLAQLVGSYFFGTGYQTFSGYVFMLIILAIRPQGLFSKATRR